MRIMKTFAAAALLAASGLCQTNPRPSFDIADVHMSPSGEWSQFPSHAVDGGLLGGDRYEWRRATMLDLIRNAYSVDADRVFGGPSWLDYNRYEIVAKAKSGTKPAVLRKMLQSLLADRFHLVLKETAQPVDGYVLTASKGNLKLRPAEGDGSGRCVVGIPLRGNGAPPMNHLQCRNATMAQLIDILHVRTAKPLQDSTGLEGTWDFDLQYPATNAGPAGVTPAIAEGLAALGLKLEGGKVPQMALTVQSVDEQPTPNRPGVAAALPRRPSPQFEVASLRPCDNTGGTNPALYDAAGRVTAHCATVLGLIRDAWNLPILQWPVGTPKSFEGTTDYSHVTILAKAPEDVPHDRDNLKAMLRALLIERYQMAVRSEDRPMDTATLVAVKPKLTKADPANRTGCAREIQPPPEGRSTGFSIQTHLVCHNMTMAQFAEQIPAYDTDIFYPVEDATGLDGTWDFTIDFDPMASRRMMALRMQIFPGSASSSNGQAVEPVGGVNLEDAIRKQLGLELKISKKPQPVLVIDHMLEKPTGN
jgi:uncharacterized protein (TIGR03435 family)